MEKQDQFQEYLFPIVSFFYGKSKCKIDLHHLWIGCLKIKFGYRWVVMFTFLPNGKWCARILVGEKVLTTTRQSTRLQVRETSVSVLRNSFTSYTLRWWQISTLRTVTFLSNKTTVGARRRREWLKGINGSHFDIWTPEKLSKECVCGSQFHSGV